MRRKLLLGLILLTATCSGPAPTPVSLPTTTLRSSTPSPGTIPTATIAWTPTPQPTPVTQATSSPTSLVETTIPSTPHSPQVEPTRVIPSPTTVASSPTPAAVFPPAVGIEQVLADFKNPVYLTYAGRVAPSESRIFVVERQGRIFVVEDGQTLSAPFLDIVDRVGSSANEQGLLSVAFPPDFETSRLFYVNYPDRRGDTIVARFRMMDGQPLRADPSSEQKLLEIAQPAGNHNGGQIQFGPDGYLYVGTGDGGRAGDPWGNAQNPEELLGKMLRIDVQESDTYRIPHDNPFLDWPNVRSEVWALGLRNPWRFTFDRVTGDLYIADVGQNAYEEINYQPAQSTGGENYGWDVMESNHCFEPARDCETSGLIPPIAEYDHSLGCSVTGGYVYRGIRYPTLGGVYFFGDFCSGRIWGLKRHSSGEWEMALLLETGANISSFGQDATGELYVLDYARGSIYHLIALEK